MVGTRSDQMQILFCGSETIVVCLVDSAGSQSERHPALALRARKGYHSGARLPTGARFKGTL